MSQNITILRNFNLIDMSASGEQIKKNKIILLENNRIQSILDSSELQSFANQGYTELDLGGKYLIPGLIDLHVHSTNPFLNPCDAIKLSNLVTVQKQVIKNFRRCIESGVTTVRDMGSPPVIARFLKMIEWGWIKGPRIVPSFSMISCPGGYPDTVPVFNRFMRFLLDGQFTERITDEVLAEKIVNKLADKGAAWIKTVYQDKSYMSGHKNLPVLSDGCYEAIAITARARKKKIAIHALSIAGFHKGIDMRVDTIEHLPLKELSKEDIRRISNSGITVIPTLIAPGLYLENMINVLKDIIRTNEDNLTVKSRKHIMGLIEQIIAGNQNDHMIDYHDLRRNFSVLRNNLRRLLEAGASIGFGTDSGGTDICIFGLPNLEMQLMSETGLTNYEILDLATRKNSSVLGLDHDLGSIERGKIADMVLLEGNPIEDLRNVGIVNSVWRNGKIEYNNKLGFQQHSPLRNL